MKIAADLEAPMKRLGISGCGAVGSGTAGFGTAGIGADCGCAGVGEEAGGDCGLTDGDDASLDNPSDRVLQPESSRDALLVSIATTPTAKTRDSALRTVRMTAPGW